MTQDVADQDLAFWRLVLRLPGIVESGVHLDVGELRRVVLQWLIKVNLAALVQLHQRHADDGLGHAEDLHDGVARHRLVVLAIRETESAEIHFFVTLIDQRRYADELPGVDQALERGIDGAGLDDQRLGHRGRGRRCTVFFFAGSAAPATMMTRPAMPASKPLVHRFILRSCYCFGQPMRRVDNATSSIHRFWSLSVSP